MGKGKDSKSADLKEFAMEIASKAGSDNLPRLASSVSFFGLLSVAPFLVLAVSIAAMVLGQHDSADHLISAAAKIGGPQLSEFLGTIIKSSQKKATSEVATALSLIVTFFSASNLFINLDDAVNTVWNLKSRSSFLKGLIMTRVFAFLSVLLFGLLLLGWLGMDASLSYFAQQEPHFKGWEAVSYIASVIFFWVGFSFTFKALPRNHLTLHDAVPGAFITAVAFSTSKYLFSYYFAHMSGGVYTAAGGIVVLLLWMYYSTIIYFIGVEITYVYSHRYGSRKNKGTELEEELKLHALPAS